MALITKDIRLAMHRREEELLKKHLEAKALQLEAFKDLTLDQKLNEIYEMLLK